MRSHILLNHVDNHAAGCVVVGIGEKHLVVGAAVECTEQISALLARRHGVECGGVERHEKRFFGNGGAKFSLQLFTAHVVDMQNVVDADGTDVEHPRRVFAKLNHTAAALLGLGEVQVAHLGDRVANAVVVGTLAHRSAGNVRNGNTENQRSTCHGKHLVAVAENDKQVGTQSLKRIGKATHTLAHRHHSVVWRVGIGRHKHAIVDVQPVALDFAVSGTISLAEVHIGGNNLQLHIIATVESLGYTAEQPPVGTSSGGNTNFSHSFERLAFSGVRRTNGKNYNSINSS